MLIDEASTTLGIPAKKHYNDGNEFENDLSATDATEIRENPHDSVSTSRQLSFRASTLKSTHYAGDAQFTQTS